MKVQTQKTVKIKEENTFFVEILEKVLIDFPKRSQEIVRARYGIDGKEALTLEEIGKKYAITRERVRQVLREVFRKIRDRKELELMKEIREKLIFTAEQNSGIMEKQALLFSLGGNSGKQQGAAKFFLECLESLKEQEIKGELKDAFAVDGFDVAAWRLIKNTAVEVLSFEKEPLEEEILFKKVSQKLTNKIERKTFFDFLEVSEEILKNNFKKWGLAKWKEITPKGTREKAYLILKEAGKPLHFKEIAAQIDKYKLSRKKTHPQTVHNELIKDKNFVLVGRGIYALAEWGYKKGTVRDVLEEILQNGKKSLTREEILDKVLKIRQVKKSTIIINLNNFFAKNKAGQYTSKNSKK